MQRLQLCVPVEVGRAQQAVRQSKSDFREVDSKIQSTCTSDDGTSSKTALWYRSEPKFGLTLENSTLVRQHGFANAFQVRTLVQFQVNIPKCIGSWKFGNQNAIATCGGTFVVHNIIAIVHELFNQISNM